MEVVVKTGISNTKNRPLFNLNVFKLNKPELNNNEITYIYQMVHFLRNSLPSSPFAHILVPDTGNITENN